MTKMDMDKITLCLAPFVTTDLTNKQSSLVRRLVHFISSHEISKGGERWDVSLYRSVL